MKPDFETIMSSLANGSNFTGGHCEAPTGWFALLHLTNSTEDNEWILDTSMDLEVPNLSTADLTQFYGHWVIVEDDQGFTDCHKFDTRQLAVDHYAELEREYSAWDDDDDDDQL